MARSTLANSPTAHQLFADIPRPVVPPSYTKPQAEFLVFPTGKAESPWRIVALGTSRTVSRHKSLTLALRKCTRLNEQRGEAHLDSLNIALSGFPDVNSHCAHYEGAGNEAN